MQTACIARMRKEQQPASWVKQSKPSVMGIDGSFHLWTFDFLTSEMFLKMFSLLWGRLAGQSGIDGFFHLSIFPPFHLFTFPPFHLFSFSAFQPKALYFWKCSCSSRAGWPPTRHRWKIHPFQLFSFSVHSWQKDWKWQCGRWCCLWHGRMETSHCGVDRCLCLPLQKGRSETCSLQHSVWICLIWRSQILWFHPTQNSPWPPEEKRSGARFFNSIFCKVRNAGRSSNSFMSVVDSCPAKSRACTCLFRRKAFLLC